MLEIKLKSVFTANRHLRSQEGSLESIAAVAAREGDSTTASPDDKWEKLESEIRNEFKNTDTLEAFADRKTYSLPQAAVTSLAEAFRFLEKCKFSIGQVTLRKIKSIADGLFFFGSKIRL